MKNEWKYDDYKDLINELEHEFFEDFIEVTHGISKELANRLHELNDEMGYYISSEIIIRFCLHEIARRISVFGPSLKATTMRSINAQLKYLSHIYLEKIIQKTDENHY